MTATANQNDLGMPHSLSEALSTIPRLKLSMGAAAALSCKICGGPAPYFDSVDFLKCAGGYPFGPSGIPVSYHRCSSCGFLFTSMFDDWTKLAFERFIYNEDYVIVDPEYTGARSVRDAEWCANLLSNFRRCRILDWGGGSGKFAATMINLGFHAESYDPFSAPQKPTGKFDIVTCIEVVEHSPEPMQIFREMAEYLTNDGIIIVGEALQPEDIDIIRCSWWYIAPRNGHCSTFDLRTFAKVAERLDFVFRSGGPVGPHAMCRRNATALNEVAVRFGPAISHIRLGAPGARTEQWHGVEHPEGQSPFQWSASSELVWEVGVPPGSPRTLIFDLPFEHVVVNFIDGCKLEVDGAQVPLSLHGQMLTGQCANVAPGRRTVLMRTPPLVQAAGDDQRMLGIAIPVDRCVMTV